MSKTYEVYPTTGIIYSGDGAWNIEIFLVKAEEFLPTFLDATIEQILKCD